MWDDFVEAYAQQYKIIDKKSGKSIMVSFLGSIKGYREVFLRVNKEHTKALEDAQAEILRLKTLLNKRYDSGAEHTHKCRACWHCYTPTGNQSEDCPVCGHDGN